MPPKTNQPTSQPIDPLKMIAEFQSDPSKVTKQGLSALLAHMATLSHEELAGIRNRVQPDKFTEAAKPKPQGFDGVDWESDEGEEEGPPMKLQMPGKVTIPAGYAEDFVSVLQAAGAERSGKSWKVKYSRLGQLRDFVYDIEDAKGPKWNFDIEAVPDAVEEKPRDGVPEVVQAMAMKLARQEVAVKMQRKRYERQQAVKDASSRAELMAMVEAMKSQAERPINVNVTIPEFPAFPEQKPAVVNVTVEKPDPLPAPVVNIENKIEPSPMKPMVDILPVRDSEGNVTRYKQVVRAQ